MPSFVVRADPAQDLYVYWSTVVDAPTMWGTRAEMTQLLIEDGGRRPDVEQRLNRADATGTSAQWPSLHDPFGGWNDDGFIVMEWDELPGTPEDGYVNLPRANLAAFVDAVDNGRSVLPHLEVRDQDDYLVTPTSPEHAKSGPPPG